MTKPHGVDPAGRPVDLIGQPLTPGIGSTPALVVIEKGLNPMAKANANGVYVLNGKRYRIRKGDVLPAGAEMEQRAKPAAPENKAKADAPENRAVKTDKKAE